MSFLCAWYWLYHELSMYFFLTFFNASPSRGLKVTRYAVTRPPRVESSSAITSNRVSLFISLFSIISTLYILGASRGFTHYSQWFLLRAISHFASCTWLGTCWRCSVADHYRTTFPSIHRQCSYRLLSSIFSIILHISACLILHALIKITKG